MLCLSALNGSKEKGMRSCLPGQAQREICGNSRNSKYVKHDPSSNF